MAANEGSVNMYQPMILIFNCENYEFWSIKMKTLFKSQYLWDLVEQGFADPDEEGKLKENRKKDSKALFLIQHALHDSVFSRIIGANMSKSAWSTLQKEFQGSSKVIVVKLQTLRRDFLTLFMNNGESFQAFLSKVSTIVSQMRSFGEKISDQKIVEKVLRSLTLKFDHVVAAIEESKDLSVFSFDDLMGSLQAHEARMNRSHDKGEEKAFQVKGESSNYSNKGAGRGQGKNGSNGKGGFQDKGNTSLDKQPESQRSEEQKNYKNVQCHYWKKYGHVKANFFKRQKHQASYAEETKEGKEESLFMARYDDASVATGVWFLDSGYSNHMTVLQNITLVQPSESYAMWLERLIMGFGSLEDRKSTSGCIFHLGSVAVTWISKKQATATLSSTEAEYIAATSAACQADTRRSIVPTIVLGEQRPGPFAKFLEECGITPQYTMRGSPTINDVAERRIRMLKDMLAFDHVCIHVGGRALIDKLEKNLHRRSLQYDSPPIRKPAVELDLVGRFSGVMRMVMVKDRRANWWVISELEG
ncbi:Retrovirus-related Pol polyprotein from transposon TNT 1-94 [Senna tora]|uniref:Retrovirus-related Pol polyprotein from transposon TNT 1-94 n=1 Tax=Senna tora TaxID=362788 RepID=A0A834TRE0_9FABA|nr:Retrovirus-related Pol polyprotein from transposon TNT 1-94 [Senna tora]